MLDVRRSAVSAGPVDPLSSRFTALVLFHTFYLFFDGFFRVGALVIFALNTWPRRDANLAEKVF